MTDTLTYQEARKLPYVYCQIILLEPGELVDLPCNSDKCIFLPREDYHGESYKQLMRRYK